MSNEDTVFVPVRVGSIPRAKLNSREMHLRGVIQEPIPNVPPELLDDVVSAIKSADESKFRSSLLSLPQESLFLVSLPGDNLDANTSIVSLVCQNAFLEWHKYKPLLNILVQEFKAAKLNIIAFERAFYITFSRCLTFDGHFILDGHIKCYEYLITTVGVQVQLTEYMLPKVIPIDDPDATYLLMLVVLTSPSLEAPEFLPLWIYQMALRILHRFPSFSKAWFSIFMKFVNPSKLKYLEHPVIMERLDALQLATSPTCSPLSPRPSSSSSPIATSSSSILPSITTTQHSQNIESIPIIDQSKKTYLVESAGILDTVGATKGTLIDLLAPSVMSDESGLSPSSMTPSLSERISVLSPSSSIDTLNLNNSQEVSGHAPNALGRLFHGFSIASWDISSVSIGQKKKLQTIANSIVMGQFDVVALQEVGDNRLLLDLLRRLGPDWSYLLSPQLKPQDGRNYVESYAFLHRTCLKVEEHGYISTDNATMSRPMYFASFAVASPEPGKVTSFSIINVHVLQGSCKAAITKLSKLLRKLPASRRESVLLVGDFHLRSSQDDWALIRDLGYTAMFEVATGIKNLTSVLTSTTQEATKIYDNIWIHQSLAERFKPVSGIDHEVSWGTGHYPIWTELNCKIEYKALDEDYKSLKSVWEEWTFEEEPFWEDSDMFNDAAFFIGSSSDQGDMSIMTP